MPFSVDSDSSICLDLALSTTDARGIFSWSLSLSFSLASIYLFVCGSGIWDVHLLTFARSEIAWSNRINSILIGCNVLLQKYVRMQMRSFSLFSSISQWLWLTPMKIRQAGKRSLSPPACDQLIYFLFFSFLASLRVVNQIVASLSQHLFYCGEFVS